MQPKLYMEQDIDKLNHELNELKEAFKLKKVSEELHDKFDTQVKEHREYLESLFNKTIKILYLIAAFLIGVIGILGFKTYWDIDKKLKEYVDSKVTNSINDQYIKNKINDKILIYNKEAIISYLNIRVKENNGEELILNDQELDLIRDELKINNENINVSIYNIIQNVAFFKSEGRIEFGGLINDRLISKLNDGFDLKEKKEILNIFTCLKSINYNDNFQGIKSEIINSNIPISIQKKYFEVLPSLVNDENGVVDVTSFITNNLKKFKRNNIELYYSALLSLYSISPETGCNVIIELLNEKSSFENTSIATKIIDSKIFNSYRYLNNKEADLKLKIFDLYLQNELIFFDFNWSRAYQRRNKSKPVISYMIKNEINSNSASGSSLNLLLDNEVFMTAICEHYSRIKDVNSKDSFFERIIIPIATFYEQYFEYEKYIGLLGRNADVFEWQSGFYTVNGDNDDSPYYLLKKSLKNQKVEVLFSSSNYDVKRDTIEINQIEKIYWESNCYRKRIEPW